jgi:hypothetical protein
MQTVTRTTRIVHYASYILDGIDVEGTAERTNGGYIFRPDGTAHKAVLVDYRNVDLLLYGRCDLVAAADLADGNRVKTCSRTLAA